MSENKIIHTHIANPFKAWHLLAIVIPSFLFFFSIFFFSGKARVKSSAIAIEKPTPEPRIMVTIGDTAIKASKADDEIERRNGLSNHTSLPHDQGMLFVFGSNSHPVFWMKDMNFPIDIIWIADGKIFQIHKNAPPEPGRLDTELTRYLPNQSPEFVLEVNGGFTDEKNIQVGDGVKFDAF